MPSPPSATGISMAAAPASRTPRAIAAAAACALSVPLNALGAQHHCHVPAGCGSHGVHGAESSTACGAQNVGVTSRAVTAGLGAVYVAASVVAPLILKTTPSDLDLYFWPSAETVVSGHPLLIYTAHLHDVYTNDNGPLGLVPLIPVAALANALGWAGSLAGRAALAGASRVAGRAAARLPDGSAHRDRAGRRAMAARSLHAPCCSPRHCGSPSSTTVMSSSPSSCASRCSRSGAF